MNCTYESELLDALGRGYLGPELEAHLASCASCTELRVVARALLEDRSHAIAEAAVPSSATMLWRMRVRHRQETETTARRSLLIGQAATLLIAVTLAVAWFGHTMATGLRNLTSIAVSPALVCVLALWIIAAPIAGWWVAARK